MILQQIVSTALVMAGIFSPLPVAPAPTAEFAYAMRMTPEQGPVDPAIQRHYTPQWKTCQHKAPAAVDNAACFQAEFQRQDARLNEAWTEALRRVPAARHRALLAAQRSWIAARDPFCTHYAKGPRGTLPQLAFLDCRVEQTIRRVIWLAKAAY